MEQKTALEIIKEKGNYEGRPLCYLIGIDSDGDEVCEINMGDCYCPECIDKIVESKSSELASLGFDEFTKIHDCSNNEPFVGISYCIESLPERDGFVYCEECGSIIEVGVLYTFSDDILELIDDTDDLCDGEIFEDQIEDQYAYKVCNCLSSQDAREKHLELVRKLFIGVDHIEFLLL